MVNLARAILKYKQQNRTEHREHLVLGRRT
jgi:hypothetical protein